MSLLYSEVVDSIGCVHCHQFYAENEQELCAHLCCEHLSYFPVGCGYCIDHGLNCWLPNEHKLILHNQSKHPGMPLEMRANPNELKEARLAELLEQCLSTEDSPPPRQNYSSRSVQSPRKLLVTEPKKRRNSYYLIVPSRNQMENEEESEQNEPDANLPYDLSEEPLTKVLKIVKRKEKTTPKTAPKSTKSKSPNSRGRRGSLRVIGTKVKLEGSAELRFHCCGCKKKYLNTKQHIMSRHLSFALYSCPYCDLESGHRPSMKRHLLSVHPDDPFKIDKVSAEDLEEQIAERHKHYFGFDHRTTRFACLLCTQTVGYGKPMEHHPYKHKFAIKCAVCSLVWQDKGALAAHHKLAHKETVQQAAKPLPVEVYNACFPPSSKPIEEQPIETPDLNRLCVKCRDCGVTVSTDNSSAHVRSHAQTEKNSYSCPHCSAMSTRSTNIKRHMARIHPTLVGEVKKPETERIENISGATEYFGFWTVECKLCKQLPSLRRVQTHLREHMKEEKKNGEEFVEMAKECFGDSFVVQKFSK